MKRETQINSNSYKEVTLIYRKYRAEELDKLEIGTKANRIVCPMVEAGRSTHAYEKQFIPGLQSKDLKSFADALEVSPGAMKMIAYFSGKKSSIFSNIFSGKFNDEAIKNGFIHTLKNGIHTGIYKDGKFSQEGLNNFVWFFLPKLKNIEISNDWLYTSEADNIYLEDSHLEKALEYNQSMNTSGKVGLGLKLSTFEMEKLLLGLLAQELTNHPTGKKGILIRDLHDLYKYGFVPATVEEKFVTKGLIKLS